VNVFGDDVENSNKIPIFLNRIMECC